MTEEPADEMVFKALADASRRKLLDLLIVRDGQTLSELEAHLPMTRFGVMKHLNILEAAGLIATRKVGREKHHYLNPTPIQQVYDRWVSRFARPFVQHLTGLKYLLEEQKMTTQHVFQVFIRTTPEKLWQALTDGNQTVHYYFGTRVHSAWQVGAPYTYSYADGKPMLQGEVLESDPPRRLVTTFNPTWTESSNKAGSRVTFEIEAEGPVCKLTLTHDNIEVHGDIANGLREGWSRIFSALKTLLETGEPLVEQPIANQA